MSSPISWRPRPPLKSRTAASCAAIAPSARSWPRPWTSPPSTDWRASPSAASPPSSASPRAASSPTSAPSSSSSSRPCRRPQSCLRSRCGSRSPTCEPGVVQLVALMESWLRYFRDRRCTVAAASSPTPTTSSTRGPGRCATPSRPRSGVGWRRIVHHTKVAAKRSQLKAGTDPEQLAFELDAVGSLANSLWQLESDAKAFGRAQTAIRTRLHGAATASGRRALDRRRRSTAEQLAHPLEPVDRRR